MQFNSHCLIHLLCNSILLLVEIHMSHVLFLDIVAFWKEEMPFFSSLGLCINSVSSVICVLCRKNIIRVNE